MKKFFIKPKMAIVEINSADIIATSGGTGGTTSGGAWGSRRSGYDDFEFFDDSDYSDE